MSLIGPLSTREIVSRYRMRARLRRLETLLGGHDPAVVFRHHRDAPQEWEKKYRDDLDELLSGLSVLGMAGLDHPAILDAAGLPAARIHRLLVEPGIREYYTRLYPYAPPLLILAGFTDDLPVAYRTAWSEEARSRLWRGHYHRFLTLDAGFNGCGPLGDFLKLLDGRHVGGIDASQFMEALRDGRGLSAFLEDPRALEMFEGLQDFFDFSEDLVGLLASMQAFPMLRGQIWLHFAYWYGHQGERLRDVAHRVRTAVAQAPPLDDDSPSIDRAVNAVLVLTDVRQFPAAMLEATGDVLERWRGRALDPTTAVSAYDGGKSLSESY